MYEILDGRSWLTLSSDYHARPNHYMAELQFTICRNPYDRAVSIWASTCKDKKYGVKDWIEKNNGDPAKFKDFVRYCLDGSIHWTGVEWLFRNQTDWYKDTFIDLSIQMENLEEELEPIIGQIDLPIKNTSDHKSWEEYMTPKIVERLNKWAGDDFKLGYEEL